jgi:hypothetical protein
MFGVWVCNIRVVTLPPQRWRTSQTDEVISSGSAREVGDNGCVDLKLKGVPADIVRTLKAEAKSRKVRFNDYLLELCQQYAERHRRMREPLAALDRRIAKSHGQRRPLDS